MSTQFLFWRTTKRLDSHKAYERLMKGKTVRGLESLDLAQVETSLIAAFSDWTVVVHRTPSIEQTMLEQVNGEGGLDIGYRPQSVTVTCYKTGEREWNRIIDAMVSLKLPLYDPQVGQRFDSVGM